MSRRQEAIHETAERFTKKLKEVNSQGAEFFEYGLANLVFLSRQEADFGTPGAEEIADKLEEDLYDYWLKHDLDYISGFTERMKQSMQGIREQEGLSPLTQDSFSKSTIVAFLAEPQRIIESRERKARGIPYDTGKDYLHGKRSLLTEAEVELLKEWERVQAEKLDIVKRGALFRFKESFDTDSLSKSTTGIEFMKTCFTYVSLILFSEKADIVTEQGRDSERLPRVFNFEPKFSLIWKSSRWDVSTKNRIRVAPQSINVCLPKESKESKFIVFGGNRGYPPIQELYFEDSKSWPDNFVKTVIEILESPEALETKLKANLAPFEEQSRIKDRMFTITIEKSYREIEELAEEVAKMIYPQLEAIGQRIPGLEIEVKGAFYGRHPFSYSSSEETPRFDLEWDKKVEYSGDHGGSGTIKKIEVSIDLDRRVRVEGGSKDKSWSREFSLLDSDWKRSLQDTVQYLLSNQKLCATSWSWSSRSEVRGWDRS